MATIIEKTTPTTVTSTSPILNDQKPTDINSNNNNTNQTKMTIKSEDNHDEGMCEKDNETVIHID